MSASTSTVIQSNIPPVLEPYFKELMENSRTAFAPGSYVPYEDAQGNPIQRIAGFSPEQLTAFQQTGNLRAGYQPIMDEARASASQVGAIGRAASQGDVYDAIDYERTPFTREQYEDWMNPYTENVLDRAEARARRRFDEQQIIRDQQAALTGSFGGSRRYVSDTLAVRDLNEALADLEAAQLSNAFNSAQGALTGQRQMGEASRQFDANTRLRGADIFGTAANIQTNLGTQQGRADLSSIDALLKTGGMQQQLGQQELDQDYSDFLTQRDWARNMLSQQSSLLRGVPITNTGQVRTEAAPSTVNQLTGAAVASFPLWSRGLFS